MDKFGVSQSPNRVEDIRLLTGKGRYVDDIAPQNSGHAAFFRSPVAHAAIISIDTKTAQSSPGVIAIYTAKDFGAKMKNEMQFELGRGQDGKPGAAPRRPVLADERVRFVGEALAIVVAETLAQAVDAAELIEFDYEDLPVHVATATGGNQIHGEANYILEVVCVFL